MSRGYNVFYDEHVMDVAWKASELFLAGETAQDVARALRIKVPQVYKAVALVARYPSAYRTRYEMAKEPAERERGE